MSSLRYVGATPTAPQDLINKAYITNVLLAANLSQDTINSLISAGFSSYATKTYVDQQDALLATEDDIDAGDATRLHLSQVGVNSGVAGLGSTGRVDSARISVPSTQRWAKAFWSPSSYNATAVTATTTETTVYTCPVSDPGFTYKLLVFGTVEGTVSLDNGEYPIVYVRVGSTSGQIVAYGGGTAESYQAPAGGTVNSRSNVSAPFTAPAEAWQTLTNWTPLNSGGYTTVMDGNYMEAQTTQTTTISAAMTFSGAVAGAKQYVSTGVRIVNDSLTVIATGTQVDGNSGTATVSWTGSVTSGQLYGIQMGQTGSAYGGTYATVSTGYFQMLGPTVANTGPITVIPSVLSAQTPLTGATTLHVTLRRSGASSTVTASTQKPNLFVAAIPA